MTLEVEICTYGLDGLQRVAQMTLPPVDGVRYRELQLRKKLRNHPDFKNL